MSDIPIFEDEIAPPSELFWDIEDAAILSEYPRLAPKMTRPAYGFLCADDQPSRRKLGPAAATAFQRARSHAGNKCSISNRSSEWRHIGRARVLFS